MMSPHFDDSNSFLFGLNHFASPQPSGSHHSQPAASTPSNMNNLNNGGPRDGGNSGSGGLLDGLDAFGGHGNDLLEGGSFTDQLALWTNANFSFDGPTGHALLGDEEKDKKDEKDGDKEADADRRAGKRSRNNQNDNAANDAANGRPSAGNNRNGKNRLRDENSIAPEPTHQHHRDQAALQQQQTYFAPPSSKADEARRPGVGQPSPYKQSQPENQKASPNGFGSANGFPVHSPNGAPFQNAFSQGHSAPHTPAPFGPQPQQPQGPLDLTSLLALQQLINQNPLALASLGTFNNLNPQLGQLGNLGQLNNLGQPPAQLLQQLQQLQQQQQQQQQQQRSAPPHAPPPSNAASPIPSGVNGGFGSQFPGPSFNGWPFANNAGLPNGQHAHPLAHSASISSSNDDKPDQGSSDEGDDQKSKMTAEERAEMLAARAAERDNIPPLKLINTGNPEADAEANRVAIEEDKRRRNTAASARFRMKKKQREAALESHTKDLEDTVSDLRGEIEKLRAENTWLKGLIQVRSNGEGPSEENVAGPSVERSAQQMPRPPANGANASSVETLQAAQQLQALAQLQRATGGLSNPSTTSERTRDHGIRPRGVGTQTEEDKKKRDREE